MAGSQHLGASQRGLSDSSLLGQVLRGQQLREAPAHVKLTTNGLTWQVNPPHSQATERSRVNVRWEGQLTGRSARV